MWRKIYEIIVWQLFERKSIEEFCGVTLLETDDYLFTWIYFYFISIHILLGKYKKTKSITTKNLKREQSQINFQINIAEILLFNSSNHLKKSSITNKATQKPKTEAHRTLSPTFIQFFFDSPPIFSAAFLWCANSIKHKTTQRSFMQY